MKQPKPKRGSQMSKQEPKTPSGPTSPRKKPTTNGHLPKVPPKNAPNLAHIVEALRPLAVRCDALNPDPDNVRLHPEENIVAIMKSLEEFGQDQPLVVQRQGMIVRKGNGRLLAARRLGWEWIAALVVDENNVAAAARAIADNRTAELATWDEEKLAQILQSIREVGDMDLEVTGFSQTDLEQLLPVDVPEDVVPEPPDEPLTKPGDLWILGEHRLLCGDAGKAEDVDRLLEGASVHVVHTDAPYGVKVEPRSNNSIAAGLSSFAGVKHHQRFDVARHPAKAKPTSPKLRARDRPLVNDFLDKEEFNRLLLAWFRNIARVLLPGRAFYAWAGYSNLGNFPPVLEACGLYFSQAIVWWKQHPVLTRKDFMGDFELAFHGWREGAAHQFFGPPNVTDVWAVKKVSPQSMVHLTQKPTELAVRALQYSSRPGENVLDLFGGSGSTLIAAEHMERRAFLMEIDPAYVDVIVERWQNLTGRKADRLQATRSRDRTGRRNNPKLES
jgi:DNA modification methylase